MPNRDHDADNAAQVPVSAARKYGIPDSAFPRSTIFSQSKMHFPFHVPVVFAAILSVCGCSRSLNYHFNEKYTPESSQPISFDRPVTCTAQKVTVSGYAKDELLKPDSKLSSHVDVGVEAEPTVWKITVQGTTANVNAIDRIGTITTEIWDVASNTPQYLILVRADRLKPVIRTITINAKYATFVHSFNGDSLGANQGTVFWGTCSN